MKRVSLNPSAVDRLREAAAVGIACLILFLSTACAGVQPAPNPAPENPAPITVAAPAPNTAPNQAAGAGASIGAGETPATGGPAGTSPAPLNSLIDPDLLGRLQSSVVGLVTVFEEPEDPWAMFTLGPPLEPDPMAMVISMCTGWFDTPTTIVTAGHCVDPAEGRLELDAQSVTIDPATGTVVPPPPNRPEPKRTVYAFQPRELAGAVITAPTIVRVDSFRRATEGDTAKLEIFGLPPATPIPVAASAPQLGEPVWSIGFPGLNITATDGIDINALIDAHTGNDFAEELQDSRIQPVSTSGSITARQYRDGVAVYQTNADLASGTSGGPTINARGQVYGINSQMALTLFGGNFNVITDTEMLRKFLNHDDTHATTAPPTVSTSAPAEVPFTPVNSGSNPPASDLPIGWTIALSAAGGAILGGASAWWIRRTRGNRSETAPEKPDGPRHRAPRDKPSDTTAE